MSATTLLVLCVIFFDTPTECLLVILTQNTPLLIWHLCFALPRCTLILILPAHTLPCYTIVLSLKICT